MSLRKDGPKCSSSHILSKLIRNFYRGKKLTLKFKNIIDFQKKLPTVNNGPIGEKFSQSGHPAGRAASLAMSRK
jgi:hypothetical protein